MIRANKPLDPTVKAFLGKEDVKVLPGFQSPESKQKDAQDKYLISEAYEYGDALVCYVAAHNGLSPEERAWGFSLGIFCARAEFPDGVEKFDEYADAGGADLKLDRTTETQSDNLHLTPFSEDRQVLAAQFAEEVATYLSKKKRTAGVNNLQAAYGLGRAFHTLRLQFPLASGGTAAFDELSRRAGIYFNRNK